jgi:threonyl-tRNA synthetase
MLHRAILGSIERFIGILIENYKGKFPFWLAPEQIRLLPLTDKHADYAYELKKALCEAGFTATVDESEDKLGGKIKNARLARACYIGIIGDKELEDRTLTIRKADGNENITMKSDDLISYFTDIKDKKI